MLQAIRLQQKRQMRRNAKATPRKKDNNAKPLPAWDSTVHDLNVHKLTEEELKHRKELYQSKNRVAAREELLAANRSPTPRTHSALSESHYSHYSSGLPYDSDASSISSLEVHDLERYYEENDSDNDSEGEAVHDHKQPVLSARNRAPASASALQGKENMLDLKSFVQSWKQHEKPSNSAPKSPLPSSQASPAPGASAQARKPFIAGSITPASASKQRPSSANSAPSPHQQQQAASLKPETVQRISQQCTQLQSKLASSFGAEKHHPSLAALASLSPSSQPSTPNMSELIQNHLMHAVSEIVDTCASAVAENKEMSQKHFSLTQVAGEMAKRISHLESELIEAKHAQQATKAELIAVRALTEQKLNQFDVMLRQLSAQSQQPQKPATASQPSISSPSAEELAYQLRRQHNKQYDDDTSSSEEEEEEEEAPAPRSFPVATPLQQHPRSPYTFSAPSPPVSSAQSSTGQAKSRPRLVTMSPASHLPSSSPSSPAPAPSPSVPLSSSYTPSSFSLASATRQAQLEVQTSRSPVTVDSRPSPVAQHIAPITIAPRSARRVTVPVEVCVASPSPTSPVVPLGGSSLSRYLDAELAAAQFSE